jgi:hypothetical protein
MRLVAFRSFGSSRVFAWVAASFCRLPGLFGAATAQGDLYVASIGDAKEGD